VAVAGALIGGAIGAFGTKPKVPRLPEISPDLIQTQTETGNLGALPGAEKLGAGVDQYNLDQLAKALSFLSPGSLEKVRSTISDQLSGTLSPEDTSALIRNATAAGFSKGIGGTGIGRNLVLRDLGLSVENQKQRGLTNLMGLYQAGPKPFDVTSMFFTPQQRLNFAFQDRSMRFERDLLAAQVKAAPDPATAALGREIDRFFNTVASFGMMAAGGGMGGAGGAAAAGAGASGGGASGFQLQNVHSEAGY
jgi:hypothetical protein